MSFWHFGSQMRDERTQQYVTAGLPDQGFIPSLICNMKSESRAESPQGCMSHGHYVRHRFLHTIVFVSLSLSFFFITSQTRIPLSTASVNSLRQNAA